MNETFEQLTGRLTLGLTVDFCPYAQYFEAQAFALAFSRYCGILKKAYIIACNNGDSRQVMRTREARGFQLLQNMA
jgi:hypothetical protein